MRWLTALIVVLLASRASAETRCYAGTRTDDKPEKIVLRVDLDATKHEIREHEWTQTKPSEHVTLMRVAADGKTLAWGNERFTGGGTVFGKSGTWTGYHRETEKYGAIISIDTKLTGAALSSTLRATHDGKVVMSIDVDAKAFDCKDLTAQRAALDGIAADAKHACFDGTSLAPGSKERVLIHQVIEQSRIVLIEIGRRGEDHMILDIDGSAVTAHDTASSETAVGTVDGKPGAWTSYTYRWWSSRPALSLTVSGTVGGSHYSAKVTTTIPSPSAASAGIEADAFDCDELEKRRAALK